MAYTEKDFNLSWGDITIGQANTLVVTRPSAQYSFRFHYDFQGVSADVTAAELETVSQDDTRVVYRWTPEESPFILVGHGDVPDRAAELAEAVRREFPQAQVSIAPIGPIIGSHTGPGMLALIFWGTER